MTGMGVRASVGAYVELTKPRIIELLLITTVPAMAVAANGWPGIWPIVVALIGGALSAGGANVINQVYDEDIDRVMRRTEARPLPTERVGRSGAVAFGVLLGIAGFVVLAFGTTLLAGMLSAVAFLGYVLVYTMVLKRSTTQNIVLGGAAGAVPALIGWAAVTGDLAVAAWVMFAIRYPTLMAMGCPTTGRSRTVWIPCATMRLRILTKTGSAIWTSIWGEPTRLSMKKTTRRMPRCRSHRSTSQRWA